MRNYTPSRPDLTREPPRPKQLWHGRYGSGRNGWYRPALACKDPPGACSADAFGAWQPAIPEAVAAFLAPILAVYAGCGMLDRPALDKAGIRAPCHALPWPPLPAARVACNGGGACKPYMPDAACVRGVRHEHPQAAPRALGTATPAREGAAGIHVSAPTTERLSWKASTRRACTTSRFIL